MGLISQQCAACLFIFLKCVEGSVLLFHSHSVTTISELAISLIARMLKCLVQLTLLSYGNSQLFRAVEEPLVTRNINSHNVVLMYKRSDLVTSNSLLVK